MLDIAYIRENKKSVEEKSKQKGYPVDIKKLLELDEKRKTLLTAVEELRQKRNALADEAKGKKPTGKQIEAGKRLKVELAEREKHLAKTNDQFTAILKLVPNMPLDEIPVGKSEKDNQVAKEAGEKPNFDFKPKTHWELGESRGLIDKKRAALVTGARFAYLSGDLVILQFAIVGWVLSVLTNEDKLHKIIKHAGLNTSTKPFLPILPPHMLKTSVYEQMDRLDPADDRYRVGEATDDLWLQGSAEHVIGSMHANEIMEEGDLPLRYIGYATSFRREAGSYGKDTEGIIRMHQFDKLEMESFTDEKSAKTEHLLMIAIQEYLMRELKIAYRVIKKCTADIGKPNASGVDIEAWMPGLNRYLETHTADYMSDYQARRLKTRVRRAAGTELVHTNDATAFALGRIIAAIMENYQTKKGTIKIPEVLLPFALGRKEI